MSNWTSGRIRVALARGGTLRLLSVSLPGPAQELADRHELGPVARRRAAEGLVATALLSAHVKGDERLTADFQVSDPACSAVFEINGDGTLRGRFRPSELPETERLNGYLRVSKSLGRKELYAGIAEVRGETIEAALQRFLAESQQVDAHVRVVADLGDDGAVEYADGLLIERLPGGDPEEFSTVVTTLDTSARRILDELMLGRFLGAPVELIGDGPLVFRCGCSREKVSAMIRSLGRDEIASMIAEQGGAEVVCHYCNEAYRYDVAELEGIRGTIGEA